MTHPISCYLYNDLKIQPQILVQITPNSYADELQNKKNNFGGGQCLLVQQPTGLTFG